MRARFILFFNLFLFAQSLFAQNFSGGFSFNLPPYDSTTRLFLPNFPMQPITSAQKVSANATGKFYAAGAPIRFWGVNVVASGCFPAKANAPLIAARMRKMGINLVRFHHLDNPAWGGSGSSIFLNNSGTRTLNPTTLDKLDYFIAQLKANGIYVNMNLNVSRTFRSSDGVPAADSLEEFAKGMTLFDPWMYFLQKEYAQQLLSHVNPYTGMSLANDPVMAMLETNNENTLFGYWRGNHLRPYAAGGLLPAYYNAKLDSAWHSFLTLKYETSGALSQAWGAGIVPPTFGEKIVDGGFESGNVTANWQKTQVNGANATVVADATIKAAGAYSAKLRAIALGSGNNNIQYAQGNLSVKKDTVYTLRFKARTNTGTRNLVAFAQRVSSPGTVFGQQSFALTSQWKTFELVFTASETLNGDVKAFFSPQQLGYYWMDEVSLKPLYQTPPAHINPNLAVNGGFETGSATPWQMELHSTAAASITASTTTPQTGAYSGKLTVTTVTGTDWHIQMKQVGGTVQKDTVYKLIFWARSASGTKTLSVSAMRDNAPYTWYGGMQFTVNSNWQQYVLQITPNENNTGFLRIAFSPLQNTGTFYLDGIAFGKPVPAGLEQGESLQNNSIVRTLYSKRVDYASNRMADVAEFYTKLEKNHLENLRTYLKTSLGVTAPITGSNALIGVQDVYRHENMDYIDDHAYWDHPNFPGTAWDPWNWYISNTPMVKSDYFNAITGITSGLAMKKKPYTISEYNHGFPNRYRTEMVPAMAAYSAFHGVDGIMFFDYNGSFDWTTDKVDGFFSLHRDNSIMGLFPSCAFAYRNGYIKEATTQYNLGYNTNWIYRTALKYDNNGRWGKYMPYDPRIALTHAVKIDSLNNAAGPNLASLPAINTGPIFTTSNNQTVLDRTKGILTTATTNYCSITGFLGDAPNTTAGDLRLVTGQEFGAITWLSLSGTTLRAATRSLITISSKLQNTNMVWDGTTTVHNNWGAAPTLIQPLTTTLRLRSTASSICVYPLDATGLPSGACTTYAPSSGYFTITLNQQNSPTLWFGVEATFNNNLREAAPQSNLSIYPNPTAGVTTLEFVLEESTNVAFEVMDMAGKTVISKDLGTLEAGEQRHSLDVQKLPAGVYSLIMQFGKERKVEKLIVE